MTSMEGTLSTQFMQKKTFAIKHLDAEMLTRQDIQFDLLHYIFADTTAAFTNQSSVSDPGRYLTFCELYTSALYDSPKCSKVLKEKMRETPAFAIEFAKMGMLANVGRINTTMAFFPEMKTALRTYHPVPSLQKTDGNLQDAPRIKNCLKAALLPHEAKKVPPSTLAECADKLNSGGVPSTSVVNLVFIMANNSVLIGRTHFEAPLEFLDLFLPVNIPSQNRARAFLWLLFHYLEDRTRDNPFEDEFCKANPGKVPSLPRLRPEELDYENIDTPEEITLGSKMCAKRRAFLKKLVSSPEGQPNPPNPTPPDEKHIEPAPVLDLAPRRSRAPRQVYEGDGEEAFRHYAPHPDAAGYPGPMSGPSMSQQSQFQASYPRPRTILQQAFLNVCRKDPLADSDDEKDEHFAVDRARKIHVMKWAINNMPRPSPP